MRLVLSYGESLKAVMSGAAATTNPIAFTEWTERGQDGQTSTSLSGVTAVTLATPSGNSNNRRVQAVSIYNLDTAAVTITLSWTSTAAVSSTLCVVTLQAGDTLTLDQGGLRVMDTSGQLKQAGVSTAVEPFAISFQEWRKTDGVTVTPVTAATTNFGVTFGSDGTNFPVLRTIDSKVATTAVVGRCVVRLPSNYTAGAALTLRARAGMVTTIADTSALLGFNVYRSSQDGLGSADLNATSAQSVNSLTSANKDYVITPTTLLPGDDLHIKMTLTIIDGATVGAVLGTINHVELRATVSR